MKYFRAMIQCEHLEKDIFLEKNIMEHIEFKGIEKWSTTKEYRFKTLEKRWFLAKGSKIKKTSKGSGVAYKDDVDIEHDSLIKLKCKHGRS